MNENKEESAEDLLSRAMDLAGQETHGQEQVEAEQGRA